MTNEEQNIAMLQALGFKHGKEPEHPHRDIWIKSGKAILEIDVADFGDDLNAMHKAEDELTGDEKDKYTSILSEKFLGLGWRFALIHATATQRREAFLKAFGLWKD